MTDPLHPVPLTTDSQQRTFGRYEVMGAALSLVWLVAVLAYVYRASSVAAPVGLVLTLLLVFLPIALIWMTIVTLRSVQDLRAEAARLQEAVEAMRTAFMAGQVRPEVEKKLDEIAATARETGAALATFSSRRDHARVVPSADRKAAMPLPADTQDDQPVLALGTPADDLKEPLSIADFVRALNFPDNAEDREGFRALRLALEDRHVAKLIRAAQDVLTLLSQEGIFMDDLRPDRARPELWRQFASGARGRAIAGLGGIRDRSSLALTAGRMREDPVFRDAAHHFLRTFDKVFVEAEANATDADLAELSDTRTARAFMLLGRVTGIFD